MECLPAGVERLKGEGRRSEGETERGRQKRREARSMDLDLRSVPHGYSSAAGMGLTWCGAGGKCTEPCKVIEEDCAHEGV